METVNGYTCKVSMLVCAYDKVVNNNKHFLFKINLIKYKCYLPKGCEFKT